MKTFIIKINKTNKKNCKKNYRKNKGFVLLFAVVLSSILLSITLGVSNIAYREAFFSTSAKNTNDAFYAADTAIECALYYDNFDIADPNVLTSATTTYCNNHSFSILLGTPDYNSNFDTAFTFTASQLGNDQKACANVIVDKVSTDNSKTRIRAVGYNNGGAAPGVCTPTTNSVQRTLEVNY